MEPAYTTVQPNNLYSAGGGLKLDYNPNVSPALVRPLRAGAPAARPMQGFRGLGALDLRPTVTFYTSAGAVSAIVDPTSTLSGTVILPIGSVPYDLDIVNMQMVLHVPYAGDVAVPLFGGGTGASSVTIPGLGDVPYELTLGPPALPAGATFSASNLFGLAGSTLLPLLLVGAVAFLFLRK